MSVVGIDLGTTNTVVACVRMGRVHVIADEQGQRLLPSVVSFHPNGTVLVGHEAKARLGVDAKNTIASVKRLIGRPWNSEELVKARQRFPFEMREGPGEGALVVARGHEYTLPEISAFVLKKAKQMAETALGEVVDKAVITVPAHFNELQRAATKVAGRVAGLEVLRILNEPTAAALAYGLGRQNNERIAVYDFGGGTFDCTLLDLSGSVFDVLATAGDTFLGGDDVDGAIADRMAEALLRQYRFDPRGDPQAFTRLKLAAETVKIELSHSDHAQVRLREVAYGVGGAHLDLTFGFTRAELESIIAPLVERSLKVTQDALALAHLTPSGFDHAVLVGGSTRIPLVRRRVEQFFGMPPLDRVNPDEVVAIGAAIQAAALADQLRRRRSIPPPPDAAAAAPPRAPSYPPLQRVHTQRGLSDVPAPDPHDAPTAQGPAPYGHTLRIDANADPTGADPTLSVFAATTSPGMGSPYPPAPPPGSVRPIPPPPTSSRAPGSHRPPPSQRPPMPRVPTPSRGFGAFGAIDDVPSSIGTAPGRHPASGPPSSTVPLDRTAPVPAVRPTPPSPQFHAPVPPPPYAHPPPHAHAPHPPPFAHTPAPPPFAHTPAPPPFAHAHAPPPFAHTPAPPPFAHAPPHAGPAYGTPPPLPPAGVTLPPPAVPPVLVDVTPRALVVEVVGGFCDVVIPRNAKIPCERRRQFATGSDNQTVVRIRVAQGEDARFPRNTYLGEVELSGLRPAVRGEVTIGVTFELDADGSLQVNAVDMSTGQRAAATLQLVGLDREESSIMMMMDRVAHHPLAQ